MSEPRTAEVKRDEDWRKTCDTWRLRAEKVEAERDKWREQAGIQLTGCAVMAKRAESAEAALRSDGYKRNIALERAEKAEAKVRVLRDERYDLLAYYEHKECHHLLERMTLLILIARIEARRKT